MTRVAVVGAGMIGRAWAMVFASAGMDVSLWDIDPGATRRAQAFVAEKLQQLHDHGLVDDPVRTITGRIVTSDTLETCVATADHVQENGAENLALRIDLFATLDTLAPPSATIASSTSGMPASAFTANLSHRHRCMVAHPANPPYLLPLVELAPAPWTDAQTVERVARLMRAAGRKVATLNVEKEGFILNRLQGALLAESFRLIDDGVVSAEDLDVVVKHGLGLRWSFMGPLETVDLNAPEGIEDFCRRYGGLYEALQSQMQPRSWSDALVQKISRARRAQLPLTDIEARQDWRDRQLMALAAHLAAQRNADRKQ
jgi:L-gulonate 3-dehydrogenase